MTLKLKMMIENEDQYVLCEVCSKAFSCGKAIGGHMRVHNPEWQGRKELARPRTQSSNGGFLDDTTCKLCGKVFPSMKSLFGHMRRHPERDWRGMNPPSAVVLPPSKKNMSWADIRNRPVTAGRGRHVCGGQIDVEEVDADLFSAAVVGLLMLAQGGEDGNEEKDKHSVGYELSDMSQSEDESEKKMISCSRSKKKRVTRKRKLKTLETVNGSKLCRCSTCTKSFPTSQALGGHRAGHNNSKSNREADEEERDEEEGGEEAASGRRIMDFDLNELPHVEDGGAVDIAFHDA